MDNQQTNILCNEIITKFKKYNNDNKDIKKCEYLKIKINEICDVEIFSQFIDM